MYVVAGLDTRYMSPLSSVERLDCGYLHLGWSYLSVDTFTMSPRTSAVVCAVKSDRAILVLGGCQVDDEYYGDQVFRVDCVTGEVKALPALAAMCRDDVPSVPKLKEDRLLALV